MKACEEEFGEIHRDGDIADWEETVGILVSTLGNTRVCL